MKGTFSRTLVCALAAVAGCAPKPPAHTQAPATGGPSASPSAQAAAGPIKAISRGTKQEPAHYIVRNKAGAVVYDVLSPTVVYDRAPNGSAQAAFTSPHIVFRGSGRTVVAESPKAVANDRDKSIVMTGGVRAKTTDGKTLTCSTLTYDARSQQILCEGDVVMTNTRTNQTASGDRLVTDPDFNHVVLSGSR